MTIDIIGGGIGGLTIAIALQKKGIDVRVFEQAKKIKPVGAGIILANNAMQVYEKLGLRKEIEQSGNPISSVNITDIQLKPISSIDLKYFEEKHRVQNIAIHRGTLQQILINQLNKNSLKLDHSLTNIEKTGKEYILQFKNGQTISSSIILGADGLNSVVRNQLFSENKIRHTDQICWRGVTDFALPQQYQNELNEAWGSGDRFGFVQIAPKVVYWYALLSQQNHADYSVNKLNTYFRNYHSIVREIIKQTSIKTIHTAIISDLDPIKIWYKENVCLLGDAAHATTPNMGQGACQAIEDAYILSECLHKFDTNKAFRAYQKLRISKAHQVVKASWTLGKIAHWKNPIAIFFRNQLMRMTPQNINRKQSEKIFQLELNV